MSEAFQETNTSGVNPLTTKGDLFTFGTANTRLGVGGNTQKVIADSTQATGIKWVDDTQIVVQAADQSFTATTTTLTDVTSLFFAMAANTSYFVEVFLLLSSNNINANYNFGWTLPAAATMFWGWNADVDAANATWAKRNIGNTVSAFATAASALNAGDVASTHGLAFSAIVRNAANAGNLQLQAAQNNAQAGTSTLVLKDSLLRVRKLQ